MRAKLNAMAQSESVGPVLVTIVIVTLIVLFLASSNWSSSPGKTYNGQPCSQVHTANWCAQAEGKPLPGEKKLPEVSKQRGEEEIGEGAGKAIRGAEAEEEASGR